MIDARRRNVFHDEKALNHLKKADPVLGAIIERVGPYKIEYREPVFQTLVRSIVYQQFHGKAASTIFGRLTGRRQGRSADARIDPASCGPRACARWGFRSQKMTYIRELARLTRDRRGRFRTLRHARRRRT